MPSTYSNLKIELIGTGEQTGTWGLTTNNNLQYAIEEAITGTTDISFTNSDVTLTFINSNLPQQARNLRLNLVGIASTPHNLIVPNIEKLYLINNTLSSAITIKNSTGSGATVEAGQAALVFNDGTNVHDAINSFGSVIAVTSGGTGVTTSTGSGSVVLNTSPSLVTPNLGIPTAGTLTNCTGLPLTGAAGITGTLPVFNGGTGVTTSTGSGSVVLSTSPALTTPNLGTPSAGNFTSGTFTWPTFNQNTTGNAATASALTSTLAVNSGGTGQTTLAANALLTGNGTSGINSVAVGTNGQILTSNGTTWAAGSRITQSTSQPTTSGTTVTFSSIPSWVKKITLMMNQVTISAGNITVQLGTSGGLVTTGYLGGSGVAVNGNTTSVGAKASGFNTESSNGNIVGLWTICNYSGNIWTAAWNWSNSGNQVGTGGGYISLAAALTQVAVVAGTGTFSAGSVNILYE